jgi:hypothetical protein
MSLDKLLTTLPTKPRGWRVYQTKEDHHISGSGKTNPKWEHPNAHLAKSLYKPPAVDQGVALPAIYEALSYIFGDETVAFKVRIISNNLAKKPSYVQLRPNLHPA